VTRSALAVLGRGLVDLDTPVLRADDLGVQRGDGVFETARFHDGAVFKLGLHLERLARSAAALALPAPDDIVTAVRRTATGVNISTVYRTLELLEELGLVTHTHLGHGPPTYHAATDDDHVHLVCRVCGSVSETAPGLVDGVVAELLDTEGFRADVGHLAIFGTCRECHHKATGV
jgi:Fur family ferric uptake transcriptional regulator